MGKGNPRKAQDHPRRCGENCRDRATVPHGSGSPPQVRGKRIQWLQQHDIIRITPAGAGKTNYGSCNVNQREDHPRRCGENFRASVLSSPPPGSPPQVRGKHGGYSRGNAAIRITPAGAGKTFLARLKLRFCLGSPPQVRGKRSVGFFPVSLSGITPAGAGKTS